MTFRVVALLGIIGLLLAASVGARAETPTGAEELVVIGEGMAAFDGDAAAAEEEAVWDAKRNAVEQAAGIFLRARSVSRDFTLVEEEIRGRSDGFIRRWDPLPETRRIERATGGFGQVLRLKIRATVALLPVIRRLADIKDVYEDLERPRIRVQMAGAGAKESVPARNAQSALIAALQMQGFEIASAGQAEVVLSGRIEVIPTVKLGDRDTPFGVGESVAASRAHLLLNVLSTASEEVLLSARAEGCGQSFQADSEADVEAAVEAATQLLRENERLFVQRLLVRWARERQEGHTVVVQATGLNEAQRARLRDQLSRMRGFRQFTVETAEKRTCTLRFQTRLDTRAIRRRLSALRLDIQTTLTVQNERGPIILCAANAPPSRTTRK